MLFFRLHVIVVSLFSALLLLYDVTNKASFDSIQVRLLWDLGVNASFDIVI